MGEIERNKEKSGCNGGGVARGERQTEIEIN